MNLRLQWLEPFDLSDGSKWGYVYEIEDLNFIPSVPGVYVFGRVHGQSVAPLYIGKARNLRRRVEQELKRNVRLMRGIEGAPTGYRRTGLTRPHFSENTRYLRDSKRYALA